jgi:hypothetical protein
MSGLLNAIQEESAPCKARQNEINYNCKIRVLKKSEEDSAK